MAEVISVRFRSGTKNYYFDPRGLQIAPDQYVIVETAQGTEYARCVEGNHTVSDQGVVQPLRPVVRIATDSDHKAAAYNRRREKEAFAVCEKKIASHKLEMKLVNVECNFEGSKIIFFFTADGRVDFRELVKDLAGVFRARIELRQIGVRDEAKMLGGLGICGRPLCCSQFLDEFIPVSIKMAKTQNLSLNPTKISGTCGRLMCCLKYEQNAYEDAAKRVPKNDSFVDTPDGIGNVNGVDLLREEVQVRLDSAPESPKRYKGCEVRVLRSGKGSREGIEIPKDRPARYIPPETEEEREERMIRSHGILFQDDPAAPAEEAREEKRRSRRRRNHKGGDKPRVESAPKGESSQESAPKAAKPPKAAPQKAPKPAAAKDALSKDASPSPKAGAQAPRAERKPNRPRRSGKNTPAERGEKVEKLIVRTTTDTTAEKKAAADRAAQKAQPTGEAKAKSGDVRRRPRRRPRKPQGGGQGSQPQS